VAKDVGGGFAGETAGEEGLVAGGGWRGKRLVEVGEEIGAGDEGRAAGSGSELVGWSRRSSFESLRMSGRWKGSRSKDSLRMSGRGLAGLGF
jgi:hypothetical protein